MEPLPTFDAAAPGGESQTTPPASDTQAASEGAAPAAQTPAPPAHVTREELLAILDERDRRTQSSLDKRDRNTQKLIAQMQARENAQRALEAAQSAGVTIPPEKQADFLKALSEQGLLSAQPANGNGHADAEPQAETQSQLDPVSAQGYSLAEMYGLTGADPEAAEIKTGEGVTPQQYLASIVLAGQKKVARLARAQSPNPAAMPGLTPGGGPARTDFSKKPRSELLNAEARKALRRGT